MHICECVGVGTCIFWWTGSLTFGSFSKGPLTQKKKKLRITVLKETVGLVGGTPQTIVEETGKPESRAGPGGTENDISGPFFLQTQTAPPQPAIQIEMLIPRFRHWRGPKLLPKAQSDSLLTDKGAHLKGGNANCITGTAVIDPCPSCGSSPQGKEESEPGEGKWPSKYHTGKL